MKTFEIEFIELSDWIKEKITEYQDEIKKGIGKPPKGHDSELGYQHAQDVQEYNRRLTELKLKYNK